MMYECLNDTLYEIRPSAIREFSALARKTPGCIALTLGEPDFDTPEVIEKEVDRAFENHETHYIANAGSLSLKKKIAAFENQKYGHAWTSDNVLVTGGAEEGLFLSLFSLLNPGDEVIIPEPAFLVYEEITKLCRGVPVLLDTSKDGFQISREKLNVLISEKTKAIVLNTPNNPTGCLLSKESLDAVHDAVKGKNILVISDDVYRQLIYTDHCPSIMDYEDMKEQCILVQSFSKPYAMTGWRMGYVCADPYLIENMTLVHQYFMTSTPAPFQRAAEKALDVSPEPFLKAYEQRRAYVLEQLEEMGLPAVRPEGAFYVFPDISKYGLPSMLFCTKMVQSAGLAVTPGIAFHGEGHVRISYCADMDTLQEGMKRLKQFLSMLEGRR